MIGIGSSAGGLAALKDVLPSLPKGQGFAYVLVQHMDPSQPSMLVEILEKSTQMSVRSMHTGEKIVPDTIYIVPAGKNCQLNNDSFQLTEFDSELGPRHTIDILFASIADSFAERCVGIVLSGTGTDGLQGTRSIKAAGGISIVQTPVSAQFADMPRAIVQDALADLILNPAEMGGALLDIYRNPVSIDSTLTTEISFESLIRLLTSKTGFDFSQYKDTTLRRRVERRMGVNKTATLEEYAACVRKSDLEAKLLLKDTLISVTGFFRDSSTFDAISAFLPEVVNNKSRGEAIRVWVAGCATGEEAFSLAMLISEALGDKLNSIQVQIFATDVDEGAITVARRSVYLPSAVKDVPKSLLARYFTHTDDTYQICRRIRDMVVFAQHDLMQDPAFTRLDIVSCRNVLIYFKRPLQEQLIATFHYMLNPGGYLVLGSSESLGKYSSMFGQPNKTLKVFQRMDSDKVPPALLQPPYFAARPLRMDDAPPRPRSYEQFFEQLLRDQYAPAGVLLNTRTEIVFVKGDVQQFLQLQPGDINVNAMEMIISPLRLEARLALQSAQSEHVTVRSKPIEVTTPLGRKQVTIVAMPTRDNGDRQPLTALVFEEAPISEAKEDAESTNVGESSFRTRELEQELTVTRDHLQSMIEQLETSNEELQSINEEYQSTTEELQASNEEFQTTNEELQSTNEELRTVNEELISKSDELVVSNTDLEALLDVAVDGIVVLDGNMRVTRYSASSRQLFDLMPTSIGKPLIAVGGSFDLAFLSSEIQHAMETGEPVEQEVLLNKRSFLVRLTPMKEKDGKDMGLVVTFSDESQRLAAATEAQRLATVLKDSNDAITLFDFEGRYLAWNAGAIRNYGYSEAEALALKLTELTPVNQREQALAFLNDVHAGQLIESVDTQRLTKDGRILDVWMTVTVLKDCKGQAVGIATTERNVTDRHRDAAEQRVAELAHVHRLNTLGEMASGLAHELNQPLAAISQLGDAAITTLRGAENADTKLMAILQKIQDQTIHAGDVIRHMRDLIKKGDSVRIRTDLNVLVKETTDFVRPQALDKHITLDLKLAESLPTVLVDHVQIGQVVLNLLQNGIEATIETKAAPYKSITVVTQLTAVGSVQISIKDSGLGLDADTLKNIFEPFHTTKQLGLGMGLSISRSIIEAHGGRIWADIDSQSGATFHFTVPVSIV